MRGLLVDTFTRQTSALTSDAQGGFTEVWSDSTVFSGRLSALPASERLVADKVTVYATHRLYCENLTIVEKDRIMLGAFEQCLEGDDTYSRIMEFVWKAQTFTPTYSHYVDRIKLKLFRQGTPGNGTVSIRKTNKAGLPIGSDLVSTTIDGDALTTDSNGEWYTYNLTATWLEKGTTYAIVCRFPSGRNPDIFGALRASDSQDIYDGGKLSMSADSDSTWYISPHGDILFHEYYSEGSTYYEIKAIRNPSNINRHLELDLLEVD